MGARYVKLGLFTVLIVGLMVGGAAWLGIRGMRPAAAYYHAYFDTSVQGLDVGSAVKFRGVSVGAVEHLGLAPDTRHIDVLLRFDAALAKKLALDAPNSPIRARAALLGVTGVKIIDLDIVDPAQKPAPTLPFEPADHTIATAPSLIEGVETGVDQISHQLPPLLDALTVAVSGLSLVADQLRDQRVVGKVGDAIDQAGAAASEVKQLTRTLNAQNLPPNLARGIDTLNQALDRANNVLERVGADGGVVSSAERAIDAFGELGRTSTASAARLDATLRDVDDAARAIRDLALELQVQPDMLVKGRARPRR